MKRINSTAKKGLLETQLLKSSECDPRSTTCLTNYSIDNSQTLKHSESSSTLRSTHIDMSLIEERFLALEQDYQNLLLQTKKKRQMFVKQRAQLDKYKINHEKDCKQIERLQSLINLAKRIETSSKKYNCQSSQATINPTKHINSPSEPKFKNAIENKKTTLNTEISIPKETNNGLRKVGIRQQSLLQQSRYRFVPSTCIN